MAGSALGRLKSLLDNPFVGTDDFGQPVADPNPLIEPSWQQICVMGYEIPGIGVIGGDVDAAILGKIETRIARVLLDERTGVVIETGISTYLPNQEMRRFVQERDGHCRFPGCSRNAKRCEPDHFTPYSRGGLTAIWNLDSLCKHHPPRQTQRWLGAGQDPRRPLHLDRPPRPPVRHPPHRPPRPRRLTDTATQRKILGVPTPKIFRAAVSRRRGGPCAGPPAREAARSSGRC